MGQMVTIAHCEQDHSGVCGAGGGPESQLPRGKTEPIVQK